MVGRNTPCAMLCEAPKAELYSSSKGYCTASYPKRPCDYMVYTWALKGFLYPYLGDCVCTTMMLGPRGGILRDESGQGIGHGSCQRRLRTLCEERGHLHVRQGQHPKHLSRGRNPARVLTRPGHAGTWERIRESATLQSTDMMGSCMSERTIPLHGSASGNIRVWNYAKSATPDLPFETPQIPSHRDHKALHRGTWGGAGCMTTGCMTSFEICAAQGSTSHAQR